MSFHPVLHQCSTSVWCFWGLEFTFSLSQIFWVVFLHFCIVFLHFCNFWVVFMAMDLRQIEQLVLM